MNDNETLALLARSITLIADHQSEPGAVIFRSVVSDIPAAMLGRKVRLTLGSRTIMTMTLPEVGGVERGFGPVKHQMAALKRLDGFDVAVSLEEAREVASGLTRTEGAFLEAAAIATDDQFHERVQLHGSRFRDADLLVVGARAVFARTGTFTTRAASLTVQAHRIFEQGMDTLAEQDWPVIRELLDAGEPLVRDGLDAIAAGDHQWTTIRWTTSLATVGGNLALCLDDLDRATFFFEAASRQWPYLAVAPVAALNVINGCFFAGMLMAMAGRREEADVLLLDGLVRFTDAVTAQKLTANVWVIGDLLNVAATSRQCFIARAKLGFLERTAGVVDAGSVLTLQQVKSPVKSIADAGLCPRFAAAFDEIADRKLPG